MRNEPRRQVPSGGTADLSGVALPELDWSSGRALASLSTLYNRAEQHAITAVNWYIKEKRAASRSSRALRAAAIVLIIIGGVIPLISVAAGGALVASWGYVFLALGAGSIAFDRFFGYSGSWIRNMQAQFRLQALLAGLQHDWASFLARLGDGQPSSDEVDNMINALRDFSVAVISVVEEETAAWAADLTEQISRMERLADQK